MFGYDCFADDSGLEVEALGGAPGVYSSRYAGEGCNSIDNMNKLLLALQGLGNRMAQFRTVIALVINGEEHLFEGVIKGQIIEEKRGKSGFGYDPVFVPPLVMIKPLPNWATTLKTASAIGPLPLKTGRFLLKQE